MHEQSSKPPLHAVIGVWHRGDETYYVKRSEKMQNYPGIWSLFSIQFRPNELTDPKDLSSVRRLLRKLSKERLSNEPVTVKAHLVSGDSDDNPIDRHVFLHLYEIELEKEPVPSIDKSENVLTIDGTGSEEEVHRLIVSALEVSYARTEQ